MKKPRRPETAAVHGALDMQHKNAPVAPPIYQTATFEVTDNEEQERVTTTDRYYTRWGNPTITEAEQAVAALEGVDAALTFAQSDLDLAPRRHRRTWGRPKGSARDQEHGW